MEMELTLTDEQPSPEEIAYELPARETTQLGNFFGLVIENTSPNPVFLIPTDPKWSPAGLARYRGP